MSVSEKNQNQKQKRGQLFSFFAFVFLIWFLFEGILGSNGHWAEIPVSSNFVLTPRLISLAVLCVGYAIYVIFFHHWDELTAPLVILSIVIFLDCILSFTLGYFRYGGSLAFEAVKTKLNILLLIPLASYRKNRYCNVRSLSVIFFSAVFLLAAWSSGVYCAAKILGWASGQTLAFLRSVLPGNMGYVVVYEGMGIYYTSTIFVVFGAVAAYACLLFKKWHLRDYFFFVPCFVLCAFTVLQSNSRGMILGFLFAVVVLGLFGMIASLSHQIKSPDGKDKKKYALSFAFYLASLVVVVGFAFLTLYLTDKFQRFLEWTTDSGIAYRLDFIKRGLSFILTPYFVIGNGSGASGSLVNSIHLEVDLLEVLIDQGLLGVVLWLGLFAILLIGCWRIRKTWRFVATAIFGIIASDFFISMTNPFETNFFGILTVGIAYLLIETARRETLEKENGTLRSLESVYPYSI